MRGCDQFELAEGEKTSEKIRGKRIDDFEELEESQLLESDYSLYKVYNLREEIISARWASGCFAKIERKMKMTKNIDAVYLLFS